MNNVRYSSFAYGFSSTYVPGVGDIGVFDADSLYQSSANCTPAPQCQIAPDGSVGDSIGVRYGSALDFGTHYRGADLAVSRSSTSYTTQADHTNNDWNLPVANWRGSSQYMNGGASNGQLIQIAGNWAFYWLNVKPDAQGAWHHYMMMSWFGNSYIGNIFGAFMGTLQTTDGFDWTWGLNNQPVINAGPVFQDQGGLVANSYGPPDGNTAGLIGNITTGGDSNSTVYFYSTDGAYSSATNRATDVHVDRRTVQPSLTHMSAPDASFRIPLPSLEGIPVIEVNYHATRNQYVALYYCLHDGQYDLCIRRFADAELRNPVDGGPALSAATFDGNDAATFGLDFPSDLSIQDQWLSQFGVRKNALGQLFTDANGDIIVYFTIWQSNVYWWGDTYAKRIRID